MDKKQDLHKNYDQLPNYLKQDIALYTIAIHVLFELQDWALTDIQKTFEIAKNQLIDVDSLLESSKELKKANTLFLNQIYENIGIERTDRLIEISDIMYEKFKYNLKKLQK